MERPMHDVWAADPTQPNQLQNHLCAPPPRPRSHATRTTEHYFGPERPAAIFQMPYPVIPNPTRKGQLQGSGTGASGQARHDSSLQSLRSTAPHATPR